MSNVVIPVAPLPISAYIPTDLILLVPPNLIVPVFSILRVATSVILAKIPADSLLSILIVPAFEGNEFSTYIPAEASPVIVITPVVASFAIVAPFNPSIPADFPPSTLIVPLLVAVPLSAKIPTDFESLSVLVIKILPLFSISDSFIP